MSFVRMEPGVRNGRLWLVALVFAALGTCPAFAHTPQDAIDSLHISPDYTNDKTVFVVVQNFLLRSQDGGASWKQLVNGLDSQYVYTDIAVSPGFRRDGTLFVATDGGGVYRSTNRGESWALCDDGLKNRNIGLLRAFGKSNLVAAGASRGLFLNRGDCGDWQRVISDDVQITALHVIEDEARTQVLGGDADGGIWQSDRHGGEWRRVARLDGVGAITSLALDVSTGGSGTLYIGTSMGGLFRSADLGGEAVAISDGWPDKVDDCLGRKLDQSRADVHIRDIEIVASAGDRMALYVTTWNSAVYVSMDSGLSWEIRSNGITCDNQADTYAKPVPHYRDFESAGAAPADIFVAGFDGLYRSSDEGRTWIRLETLPVYLIRGVDVSGSVTDDYGIGLATYGGGAYISLDKGSSWTIANHGLVTTRLADLEFSPGHPGDPRIFGLSKERLLINPNGGSEWSVSSLVYRGWRKRIGAGLERHLNVPPEFGTGLFLTDAERRRIWPMQIELSPEFVHDRTILIGLREHGVWKSQDAGASWDRDWEGPIGFVTALQVSPAFANDGTAFVGIRDNGIYVTRDGGDSWESANAGFEFLADIKATASPNYYIDPPLHTAIKDVLLVISPDFGDDQTVFASSSEGLFKSVDGGQSWTELPAGDSDRDIPVIALGVSPDYANDRMIFVSLKGHGLIRSTDGGATFDRIGPGLLRQNHDVRFLEFSPRFSDDATIYAATDEVLLRSGDRGMTWTVIERPVRYEDWRGEDRGPVLFSDEWVRKSGDAYSASTQAETDQQGAEVFLNFVGTSITWIGERGPEGGVAKVRIDGTEIGEVSLRNPTRELGAEIMKIDDLTPGGHTLTIEVSAANPVNSTANKVYVDAFDVRGFLVE